MARELAELDDSAPVEIEVEAIDPKLAQRTGRSFAGAISVLLLATLVVSRSDAALSGEAARAAAVVESGTIELDDDDEGRSLFDVQDLVPGRPIERCIDVIYTGSILPVSLAVRGEANGPLVEFADIVIETGAGGNFDSCDGFVADGAAFRGSVVELTESGAVELGTIVNAGEDRAFRITLALRDELEALGQQMTMEFAWDVTPS